MAKEKLNQGHYKEALDRCICISKIIPEVVQTHPAIEQNEPASDLIQGAYVFESLLEIHCKAGDIGHHIAQELAHKFE